MDMSGERVFIVLNEQFNPPILFNNETLTFTVPEVTTLHDRNTMVTVKGIPGRGYYGDVDIYYDRLDIGQLVDPFVYRTAQPITAAAIASTIEIRTGIDITGADLETIDLEPSEDGWADSLLVKVDSKSLQWRGVLELPLEYGTASLESVIRNKSLGITVHPNPKPELYYGRMLGWNVDFSGVMGVVRPDSKRRFTNWEQVQFITSVLGWPTWVQNTVFDRATSEVPDANPAFERVFIQEYVNSPRIVGPIYFHYNPIQGYE